MSNFIKDSYNKMENIYKLTIEYPPHKVTLYLDTEPSDKDIFFYAMFAFTKSTTKEILDTKHDYLNILEQYEIYVEVRELPVLNFKEEINHIIEEESSFLKNNLRVIK